MLCERCGGGLGHLQNGANHMPNPPGRVRDTYRHGDVRGAAVAEGTALLAHEPNTPLSLREIARRVGVAHHALHHHFGDKSALERALAAHGFHQLADCVADTDGPAAFVSAYARFALANRRLYELMMSQPYAMLETDAELRRASGRVIATAVAVFAPAEPDAETARRIVARSWMLTHGGLALHATGALRMRDDEAFVAELLRIAGLAPNEPDGPQPLWGDHIKEHQP